MIQKRERLAARIILTICCTSMWTACVRTAGGPPVVGPEKFIAENEPEFIVGTFHVLNKAEEKPSVPSLATQDGKMRDDCFETLEKPTVWETGSERAARLFKENRGAITAAVLTWLAEDIFPEEKELFAAPAFWRAETSTPMVRHVFPAEIRLREDQKCIDDRTRDFPPGSRTVTTFFGAREITFRSARPVLISRIRALRQAALKKKLRLVVENPYTPALDENGKQRRGPKRKKLFNSPSGALITRRDVPPPKLRQTTQWKLVLPQPVFFAAGDLPQGAWKKENLPEVCEVYLVYNEAVPQVPACAEFNAAGFGAERAEEQGHVLVKVASADETVVKDAAFGAVTAVTIGKAAVWVTPTRAEEGAHLKIDSLVLDTGAAAPSITSFPAAGKKSGASSKNAERRRNKK
jgi:hypothetical protein